MSFANGIPSEERKGTGQFNTTHWSVVLQAGDGTDSQAASALEKLCATYWYPLYATCWRHCGVDCDLKRARLRHRVDTSPCSTLTALGRPRRAHDTTTKPAADCKQAASLSSSFRTIRHRDTLMVSSLGWRTLPLCQAPRAVGKVVSRFKRLSHNRLGIAYGVFATHTDPWK